VKGEGGRVKGQSPGGRESGSGFSQGARDARPDFSVVALCFPGLPELPLESVGGFPPWPLVLGFPALNVSPGGAPVLCGVPDVPPTPCVPDLSPVFCCVLGGVFAGAPGVPTEEAA